MKLVCQYTAIFITFPPTSNHLHPLQVENCGSNSRLVVDEDDNGIFRLEKVEALSLQSFLFTFIGRLSHCYWERDVCLNINICKCFLVSNLTNVSNAHPLTATHNFMWMEILILSWSALRVFILRSCEADAKSCFKNEIFK